MILFLKIIPLLFAGVCILTGLLLPHAARRRIRRPVYTEATVVSCVRQQMYRNRADVETLAPVVRYQTPDGEMTAAARLFVPEWQYRYRTGDKVRICYDRSRPSLFVLCDSTGSKVLQTLFLTAGIGTILAYGVLWMQYY